MSVEKILECYSKGKYEDCKSLLDSLMREPSTKAEVGSAFLTEDVKSEGPGKWIILNNALVCETLVRITLEIMLHVHYKSFHTIVK